MSRNATRPQRRIAVRLLVAAVLVVSAAACEPSPPGGQGTASGTAPGTTPGAGASSGSQSPGPTAGGSATGQAGSKPGHVFVINLENKGYYKVWGEGSEATYLSQTLRSQGVLLSDYYGIAHNSNPNYLAQISGQASNAMTRNDCPTYAPFQQTGTAAPGQVEGTGCVYPASVPTVAGQLSAAGKTWKGYMEDMGSPCRHPDLGAKDTNQNAKVGDQYATRHNPFVYFESITSSPDCQSHVVDLVQSCERLNCSPTC